ncbi:hypothetical protein [Primorskyibacter sp. S187A]|uniref:hypothetical protein n=1 Tax=Primorskyibacter sp. S187A TaxID=3415130 RepID=UPI003C7BAF52
MVAAFVIATGLAALVTLGCWLEISRAAGWRFVWAPLALGVLCLSGAVSLEDQGYPLTLTLLLLGFFLGCAVAFGGLAGALLRGRSAPSVAVRRTGLAVWAILGVGLSLRALWNM